MHLFDSSTKNTKAFFIDVQEGYLYRPFQPQKLLKVHFFEERAKLRS